MRPAPHVRVRPSVSGRSLKESEGAMADRTSAIPEDDKLLDKPLSELSAVQLIDILNRGDALGQAVACATARQPFCHMRRERGTRSARQS